ncbi:hypothetical protein KA005_43625, partial [bacterium]|nr:hypothetical protein [bacterium]
CAWCEAWSYYDAPSVGDFAIDASSSMLVLQAELPGLGKGRAKVRLPWFEQIFKHKIRRKIIESVLSQKMKDLGKSENLLAVMTEA